MNNKFYLEGKLELQEETSDLKEKAAKVIELPSGRDKQPDLQYFSAILVSSGQNLNNAYFMGSELVAAENTIVNKALDVEHQTTDIIGHLYQKCFIDKDGNALDTTELASSEVANLDLQDMHIAVAGVVYKDRFPNIAQEISDQKWQSVSMECYYQNYDVKIGNLILNTNEAEALGLACNDDKTFGRKAKVLSGGKEISSGSIARVLRGICFSGCGIVKNPANPASIILETASGNNNIVDTEEIILDYDKLNNSINVTSANIDTQNNNEQINNKEESRDGTLDDTTNICVSYKRRVCDKDDNIIANDWCSKYDKSCTSFSRDTSDPDCLYVKEINDIIIETANKTIKNRTAKDNRVKLLDGLKAALCEAVKTLSQRR